MLVKIVKCPSEPILVGAVVRVTHRSPFGDVRGQLFGTSEFQEQYIIDHTDGEIILSDGEWETLATVEYYRSIAGAGDY